VRLPVLAAHFSLTQTQVADAIFWVNRTVAYHRRKPFPQVYKRFHLCDIPITFDIGIVSVGKWGFTVRAGVTQLVECDLAKVDVAGSNPVSRSIN
jgi:hypothetical protein